MFQDFQPLNKPLLAGVRLPKISIEPRFYEQLEVSPDISNYEFLRRLCWKGVQEKGIDKFDNAKEYYARIKKELDVFQSTMFVDYVLLNWEVHNFCKENNIVTGWGRGSAASSLVLYLLNVTKLDPLEYNLYFERFLSEARAKKFEENGVIYLDGGSLCDVDSDIANEDRHKVIEFIKNKHPGKTAKILTLGTLSSKLVIRECCKIVDGLSEDAVDFISSSIPKAFNIPLPIEDALKESEKFLEFSKLYPRSFIVAKKLENLVKNTGIHASGIAICSDVIGDVMPVQYSVDKETGEEGLSTGFEMGDVSSLCVKFDILGLKTLSIVSNTCKAIGIRLEDLPKHDDETYKFLQNLMAPQGLFQIETDVGYRVCQKVKPRNLEDLASIVSLARPGALAFVDKYAEFVKTGQAQSIHPFFDEILSRTGSIPVFQEQLMAMVVKTGFSLDDSNEVRSCVGKKKVEEMMKWEKKIYDKVAENNLDKSIADVVWKVAKDSANYSFCAGHAFPYAYLCFITAFLKTHYTKEFFCAALNVAARGSDSKKARKKIANISIETPLFNMRLLPPDLTRSKYDFSVEGRDIRYGWVAVKSISDKTLQPLISFSDKKLNNKYDIFFEAKFSGLSIGNLSTLIQAGCLDSFGENRCKMVLEAQMFNKLTEKEKLAVLELGEHHKYDIFAALKDGAEGKIINAKNKSAFTDKRIEKLREEHGKYKQIYDQNIKHQKFCNWYFEREMLGYSYSYTLREVFEEPKHTFTPVLEFNSLDDNTIVRIVGVVTEVKKTTSKKGNKYMMLSISDESGKVSGMFGDNAKDNKWSRHLEEKLPVPEEDSVVTVVGKKFGDLLMIDRFSIVEEKIFTKLSQTK